MKIGLVCSHGGHLTETLQILDAFEGHEIFFVTYHSSREAEVQKIARAYFMNNIGTSALRMMVAWIIALRILIRERPAVIVSLGAEIAIPFLYLSKILIIRTLFIESWCWLDGRSKTGRLVYPVASQFWVQWPQTLDHYGPKAKYFGAVI